MAIPPAWLLFEVAAILAFTLWTTGRMPSPRPRPPPPPPGTLLVLLRCAFIVNIIGTMVWSMLALSDVQVCSESGDSCLTFRGGLQFSTFTRWSWLLQGIFYVCANLQLNSVSQSLFGVCLSSALLTTFMSYTVLVPGALLIPQPAHKASSIRLLLSPQAHIMHTCNTLQIVTDLWLCRGFTMQPAGMRYGVGWPFTFLLFEWAFYDQTGEGSASQIHPLTCPASSRFAQGYQTTHPIPSNALRPALTAQGSGTTSSWITLYHMRGPAMRSSLLSLWRVGSWGANYAIGCSMCDVQAEHGTKQLRYRPRAMPMTNRADCSILTTWSQQGALL